jgi:carbonic anhydrase/acetyltransferase-like protein (isoleucine patch superfamily)
MISGFRGIEPLVHPDSFIAWNAQVSGDVELGVDVSVWYGAVIRGDTGPIRVGRGCNVQDGAILHVAERHPCVLGEDVTVGHGAIVHACTVGDRCLIGMGAIILDGAVIGEESIVGAGALVTGGKSFPPRSLIVGSPAKALRGVTEEEVAEIRERAAEYVLLARETRGSVPPIARREG